MKKGTFLITLFLFSHLGLFSQKFKLNYKIQYSETNFSSYFWVIQELKGDTIFFSEINSNDTRDSEYFIVGNLFVSPLYGEFSLDNQQNGFCSFCKNGTEVDSIFHIKSGFFNKNDLKVRMKAKKGSEKYDLWREMIYVIDIDNKCIKKILFYNYFLELTTEISLLSIEKE